jgi:hypothetical protein
MILKPKGNELGISEQLTICDLDRFVLREITDGDGIRILLRTIYEGMVHSGIRNSALGTKAERSEKISVSR